MLAIVTDPELIRLVGVTPQIDGDGTPATICWWDEAATVEQNVVGYARSADGHYAFAHPFSETVAQWFESIWADAIAAGKAWIFRDDRYPEWWKSSRVDNS